jgi:hypothetical protein
MKKLTVLVASFALPLILALPAVAQTAFGIKGGATFSKTSFEDDEGVELSYLTAIGGGAFLRLGLGGIGLQPEVLYGRKGVNVSGADLDEFASIDLKLDYIEVPVLLVVSIGSGGGAAPYAFGGGAVSFEVGCNFAAEGAGLSAVVDCDDNDLDLELERKTTDFSAVFGGGVRIPTSFGAFLLEGRYTLGLADLSDSGNSGEGFKNRAIAAFAGLSFTIGG